MSIEEKTVEERIISLIEKFPDFKNSVPSYILSPWDAGAFDRWAANTPISDTEHIISQFILMVWDYRYEWKTGRLYLADAVKYLSDQSLDVIREWTKNPFLL